MNAGRKLGAFALVLGVAFGGGAAVGKAAGPIDVGNDGDDGGDRMEQMHVPEAEAPAPEAGHDHATMTSEPPASAEPQEQP